MSIINEIESELEKEFAAIKSFFHAADWHTEISKYIASIEARISALEAKIAPQAVKKPD